MTGYALETGSTGVDLEKRSRPKLTTSDASIYPKPDRIVSGPSPWIQFLDRRKAEAIVGYPAKAGNERKVARQLRSSSSRRKKSGASLGARGRRNVFEKPGDLRSSSRFVVSAEAPTKIGKRAESLPLTIVASAPKCWRNVVSGLALPPSQRPGARHATRKLMAPPLRFFVLSAFLSLGNRCAGLPNRHHPLLRFLTFSAV